MTGLVKVFQTPLGDYYAYDGATNRIMTIGPRLIRETEEETEAEVRRYLLEQRIVSGDILPGITWAYDFPHYLEWIGSKIPVLLLQVTRRCNLDCDYCVYSGNYTHMGSHANQDMSLETLRRSIDFFAAHSGGLSQVTIDLYGGEALLRLDLVREAVRCAKQVMPDKTIVFRITSNGVLLDETAAQFLEEHPEVRIMVTVNGPFHDRHRKDLSGGGSLEQIMKNLRALRKGHPRVWDCQLHFIANIAHSNHLPALVNFYRKELGKPPDTVTHIRWADANDTIRNMLSEETGTEAEESLRLTYCKEASPYLEPYFGHAARALHHRQLYADGDAGHIGSCMPLLGRLFVQADGRFGICESCCDKAIVGDLERGFDLAKLRQIYDGARYLFHKQCRACWAQRLCTVCLKDVFAPDGTFLDHIPEDFCLDSQRYASNQLRTYCAIADRIAAEEQSG